MLQVETLLASFLKDVGISEEQFMTACKDGSGSPQFHGINRVSMRYPGHSYFFFLLFSSQFNFSLKARAFNQI